MKAIITSSETDYFTSKDISLTIDDNRFLTIIINNDLNTGVQLKPRQIVELTNTLNLFCKMSGLQGIVV